VNPSPYGNEIMKSIFITLFALLLAPLAALRDAD
jgi:hypothetical protein